MTENLDVSSPAPILTRLLEETASTFPAFTSISRAEVTVGRRTVMHYALTYSSGAGMAGLSVNLWAHSVVGSSMAPTSQRTSGDAT